MMVCEVFMRRLICITCTLAREKGLLLLAWIAHFLPRRFLDHKEKKKGVRCHGAYH